MRLKTAIFIFSLLFFNDAKCEPHGLPTLSVEAPAESKRDTEECKKREKILREAIANSKSVSTTLKEIVSSNPDVILLGESHFHHAGILEYSGLLNALNEVQYPVDCIFYESDRTLQEFYDSFLSGAIDFDAFSRAHYTLNSNSVRDWLTYAKEKGIKVYAVDDVSKDMQGSYRNVAMVAKMEELIKSKACKKSIQIGGSGHHVNLSESPSMQVLLRKKNFRVSAVRLVDNNGDYRKSPLMNDSSKFSSWTWNHCMWNPEISLTAYGFSTTEMKIPLYTPIGKKSVGKWSDSDAALVIPYKKHY